MAEQNGEKTFDASARKLQRARNKGQLPRSQELTHAVTLMALMLSLWVLSRWVLSGFEDSLRTAIVTDRGVFDSIESFDVFCRQVIFKVILLTAPFLGVLMLAGVGGTIALGGVTFSGETLRLRWDSLNPAQNITKLITMKSLVQLLHSIVKITVIGLIIWFYLRDKMEVLAALRWAQAEEILQVFGSLTIGLCIRICVVLIAIALTDTLYQRWKYYTDMKMTQQEVKQEHKDTEGSPHVKSRQRRVATQRLMQNAKKAVPTADVVLVNPTHYAVAIKYDGKTMQAPVVVAKGADHIAQQIREVARAYGVPIVRRPELARTLFATVKINESIPEGLYMAVAEVLAMLHRIRQQKKAARAMR